LFLFGENLFLVDASSTTQSWLPQGVIKGSTADIEKLGDCRRTLALG